MNTTDNMHLTLTRHACKQAAAKGFTAEQIQATFDNPKKVYPSKSHPGQFRIVSKEICLVGVKVSATEFRAITLHENGVTRA